VYDELWESCNHLTEIDNRVVFLLELNAWMSILKEQLIGIQLNLKSKGNVLFVLSSIYYRTLFHINK